MEIVYTLTEAAEKLGFSRKTLQREINAGRYPNSFKVGKRSCTHAADIERYRQQLTEERTEETRKREAEAAGRLQFQRELEAFRRLIIPAGCADSPFVRAFKPDDPNRLP
jgi:predicted DNA-binding transcriptional regulator AlpA